MFTLTIVISQAQQIDFIQIKDPIIDNTLTLTSYVKFDAPRYIINSNYVVFQGSENTRKILNADIASFRFPVIGNRNKHFALDKNGVYFNGIFIETDTTGFQIVNEIQYFIGFIWKTNDKVFLNEMEITKDIDVPSFQTLEVFNRPYQKDKNYIYYKGQKIKGSDGSSAVRSVIEDLVYDKNYVFHEGEVAFFEGDTIRSINHNLGKTEKYVLRLNPEGQNRFQPSILPEMDAKTIKPLSRFYSMDKNFVYFRFEKTPVLPKNFNNVRVWDQINSAYISDGINVYAGSGILKPELDAKTFGMLSRSDFFFDKNGIYDREWDRVNEKSVIVKFPFNYTKEVTEANTFNSYYVFYENQAYSAYSKKELFKNLTQKQINLAKNGLLNNFLQFVNIDGKPRLRKGFDYLLYEVNNEIHWNDKKTIADAPTFKRIPTFEYNFEFYKDKRNVYIYNREKGLIPVRGIDVQTVTVNKHNFLADKDYIYANNFRVIRNNNVELLAIFEGYRPGCGMDRQPSSDYYLFKNNEGYWLVLISNEIRVRSLGH
jgi:hypothetical protein